MPRSIEDLDKSVESLIQTTTEGLKSIPAITEKKIDEEIGKLRSEMKEYVDKVKQNNVTLGLSDKDKQKFSFAKVVKSLRDNDGLASCDFEREVIHAAHQKATVNGSSGGAGGYLIPVDVAEEIMTPAIADTVMAKLGVTVLPGLTGDFAINGTTTRPTLSWTAENVAPTAQTIGFNQKMMRPKTGKMMVTLSNKLLMQASVAEMIVRNSIQEGVTLGLDNVLINGTGLDNQPLGIINSGIPTSIAIGTNGGRLRFDKVAQMITDIQVRDYLKTGMKGGLLTNPRGVSGMKRERVAQFSGDTAGQPLINPLMTDAMLQDLLGIVIASTTNVPSNVAKGSSTTLSYAIVGEWAQFVVGYWGGLRLKSSDVAGTAFANDELWFYAAADIDSMVKQTNAFTMISDVETLESAW